VVFLLGRNIRRATQRAARRCAGTHPGPLGCLSTSPRTVPVRSSASATHVVPSCPIPTSCSLGGRKPRVDSAPMMAQQCAILTVRLASSEGPWGKPRSGGGRGILPEQEHDCICINLDRHNYCHCRMAGLERALCLTVVSSVITTVYRFVLATARVPQREQTSDEGVEKKRRPILQDSASLLFFLSGGLLVHCLWGYSLQYCCGARQCSEGTASTATICCLERSFIKVYQ